MLSIRRNGSIGVVQCFIACARKSFTVCACADVPGTTKPSATQAHSANASFFIGFSPGRAQKARTVRQPGRGSTNCGKLKEKVERFDHRSVTHLRPPDLAIALLAM